MADEIELSGWEWLSLVQGVQGVSPGQKLVLVMLAGHCDQRGRCFPSKARIARFCCMSIRSCDRAMNDLRASGLISWEIRSRGDGSQTTNLYQLNLNGIRQAAGGGSQSDGGGGANSCGGGGANSGGAELPVELPEGKRTKEGDESSFNDFEKTGNALGFDRLTGKFTGIDEDFISSLETRFPSVAIRDEIEQAGKWLEIELLRNPTRAAKRKDVKAFLANWMFRTKASGEGSNGKRRGSRGGSKLGIRGQASGTTRIHEDVSEICRQRGWTRDRGNSKATTSAAHRTEDQRPVEESKGLF